MRRKCWIALKLHCVSGFLGTAFKRKGSMNILLKQRGFIWIEQIFKEIRYSLRMLRKNPGFTAIAVISLALAIGVNSGSFWYVNAMLFKPLIPLRPNEVVSVYARGTAAGPDTGEWRNFSFSEFSLLRESKEVFTDVASIYNTRVGVATNNSAEKQWKSASIVSDNFFSMLGVTPAAGRFFLLEESRPNANIPVAVVSPSLWERLGGGNDFNGRTLTINGTIHNVVGMVPRGFSLLPFFAPEIWLPMGMASRASGQDLADAGTFTLYLRARLQPGLTLEAAKARMPVLADRFETIAANADEGARTLALTPPPRVGLLTAPPPDGFMSHESIGAAFLIGMAGVVLLVACLNLANMFLARNTTRSDELSVRLALGASCGRAVRILSVEGLIIAMLGGAAGLLVSHFGISLFVNSMMNTPSFASSGVSLSLDTTPDIRVLLATLLFCVIATLVFATLPAWHIIRKITKGNLSLQHATRTTTDRWGRLFSGRQCLLMAQLAFSLVLLFSGGLFFRGAAAAARIDPGFDPRGDLVAEINYHFAHRDEESVRIFMAALGEELRTSPGVSRIAVADFLPFGASLDGPGISVTAADAAGKQVRTAMGSVTAVSRDYFDTLGIKLLRGRDFTERECQQPEGPFVVIIDQGMADALFPGENPLGKYVQRFQMPGPEKTLSEPMEIVGVVSTHWNSILDKSPPPRIFFPFASRSPQHVYVHVKGQTVDATASVAFREQVRSKLISLDPDIPLESLKPYTVILKEDMGLWLLRFAAVLSGVVGSITLLLAVIGVYGVRAFFVARRRREIGIRMALGASPRRIYALLIKQGAVQISIGLGAGMILSLAAGRLLASMLLHVSPGEPLVLGVAALILVIAAFLATWIPARRAAKVDPMEVLRWE